MKHNRLPLILLALLLLLPALATARPRSAQYPSDDDNVFDKPTQGPRAQHWSGFDVGFSTPFPSIVGALIGFNIGDDARLGLGYGVFGSWNTYSLDGKIFLGKAAWAGYIGGGIDYISGQRSSFLAWNLQFNHAFVPYLQAGVDFQSDVGVHCNFNLAGTAPNGQVLVLPGIGVGWYF